jgi:hypothetical protein
VVATLTPNLPFWLRDEFTAALDDAESWLKGYDQCRADMEAEEHLSETDDVGQHKD